MAKLQSKRVDIYSIKLELDGATKILTLRVGAHFTELSLAEGGKITEVARQEHKEITLEKFR